MPVDELGFFEKMLQQLADQFGLQGNAHERCSEVIIKFIFNGYNNLTILFYNKK